VPKAKTKNARFDDAVDFRVPLIGRALEIAQRRLATVGESGWLFENTLGEQYTQHSYSTYIYDLQPYSPKSAHREGGGLPVTGWTPHNLRRTSRTLLASLGCPSEIAEEIMGHMPAEMVATYNSHTYDAERRHWLGLLSARLETLAQG
jgi:integrase